MKRNSLSPLVLVLAQKLWCYLMLESQFVMLSAGQDPEIYSAPSENVTVPLGQTSLIYFDCSGDGFNVLWIINGRIVDHISQSLSIYEDAGITFRDSSAEPLSGTNISIGINVTIATNNNTELKCYASDRTTSRNCTSSAVTLTIAGPPLAPHPKFQVVNATHIEVKWDKPFTLPDFDVISYTLLVNTSFEGVSLRNQSFSVSANTTYPIRFYLSNGGDIPKECVYINFLLTAKNDAGESHIGSVMGGFPIAPSPIPDDTESLQHKVTFTSEFIPTLHINFTFPELCDYHDARYSILILGRDGSIVYQSMEETYYKESPDNVEVMISNNLQKDSIYTAEINVSTAVNWTKIQFIFNTNITPEPLGVDDNKGAAGNRDTQKVVIISATIAAGFGMVMVGLIVFVIIAGILRRKKFKQRSRAHRRELETDEAVQRAAQAMVPNPIYSGNPIYEEIVDSLMLKSLRNENASRDEGYVAISADAVKNVNRFPLPEESTLVEDKYATFPEDTYTVMNPAGTLSNQSKGPAYEIPFMHRSLLHANGNLREQNHLTETNTADTRGEHCAAAAGSAPATAGFTTQDQEERYVKGTF